MGRTTTTTKKKKKKKKTGRTRKKTATTGRAKKTTTSKASARKSPAKRASKKTPSKKSPAKPRRSAKADRMQVRRFGASNDARRGPSDTDTPAVAPGPGVHYEVFLAWVGDWSRSVRERARNWRDAA